MTKLAAVLFCLSLSLNVTIGGIALIKYHSGPRYEVGTCLLDPAYGFERVVDADIVNRRYTLSEQVPEQVFSQELVSKGEDPYHRPFDWVDKTYMVVPCRLDR